MSRFLALAALVALASRPAVAQHALADGGAYDPGIPTPASVLGYAIGERFTPHHEIVRYAELLAEASPRVRLDTVAKTFEGREVLLAIVTSEANQMRLDEIRRDAQRLADPRGASAAELAAVVDRLPAIVWLGYTVHGGEASGTEAALAMLYQLASGTDAETRMILDSTVVLIDPVQNADGHERHVQDVMRMRGALRIPTAPGAMIHDGSWPGPRTSHYYFDLNRDWFILSHPSTRGRVATFREWAPHVAVDLHEMGSNSTYFFAPPMQPFNENLHESIIRWWDIYAASNAAAFDAYGWSYFRREGYDEFYPGYGVSWPSLTGAVGMTYEEASSGGGAIRREDGTILTLREAARHHYTAAWATALTTARRRHARVADYLAFRRSAITDAEDAPMRAILLEPDAQGRAQSLVRILTGNGIEVQRLGAATDVRDATAYGAARAGTVRLPAGTYVVDLAQPQGRLAKALLEPDAKLDSSFIAEELESRRLGRRDRFYDITAWSLPYTFRVRAWWTPALPGPLEPLAPAPTATVAAPTLPEAGYGYAFEAGSEASIRFLAGLLADSVRVWYAPRPFRIGTADFPHGAFVVRVAANDDDVHDTVRRHAAESGARVVPLASALVDEGTDLGSNSVTYVAPPRVGLVGGPGVSGNSFGFAWFAFDQRIRYPVTTVSLGSLPGMLDELDVVVLPSASAGGLERALGEDGRGRLAAWVRGGGVLITLDGATAWLAAEDTGLSDVHRRREEDPADGRRLPANIPGAIVRVVADTLSPLMAGIHQAVLPAMASGDRVYEAPPDVGPGVVVARYAAADRLRLSGYLWPESPDRLAGTPYLWTDRVGRGRIIAFAQDPNFRDLWRGWLPIFANAVFLGPAMR
ncbi:MAG TPA: M14 family zinc carboxypeptidase [Longimicrobiales bacterium]